MLEMMDISAILQHSFAGSEWTLNGDSYAGLTWLSDSSKPSEAELQALWPQVQYEQVYGQVERARHEAYIASADPVFFRWQRGSATEQEWLDAVQAVKDAHPYPAAP